MNYKSHQGLTLVELMVALAVGLVLVGTILQIFISNKANYRTIDGLSEIQESTRLARIILSNQARQLSYQGCGNNNNFKPVINVDLDANAVKDNIDHIYNNNAQLFGRDNVSSLSLGSKTVTDATDTFRFQYSDTCGGQLIANMDDEEDDLEISDANSCSIAADAIILVTDCGQGDVFVASSLTSPSGKLVIKHNQKNIKKSLSKRYLNNAEVFKINSFEYFIADNSDGISTLMRLNHVDSSVIELFEGIEDMQILYGEDTDGNGTPNRYLKANTSGLQMSRVVNIYISLLMSSSESITSKAQPAFTYPPKPFNSGSGSTFTPSDRKLYKVLNFQVALRNQIN